MQRERNKNKHKQNNYRNQNKHIQPLIHNPKRKAIRFDKYHFKVEKHIQPNVADDGGTLPIEASIRLRPITSIRLRLLQSHHLACMENPNFSELVNWKSKYKYRKDIALTNKHCILAQKRRQQFFAHTLKAPPIMVMRVHRRLSGAKSANG